VVGDFTEEEVESSLLSYIGTVAPESNPEARKAIEAEEKPVAIDSFPSPDTRHQQVRNERRVRSSLLSASLVAPFLKSEEVG
jgi:hypothetical protein